jgi:hypothetical protein
MTAAKAKPADEPRMSAAEFDRIMGKALHVKPEGARKGKSNSQVDKKRHTAKPTTQKGGSK